jgi:hypothetical protein
MNRSQLQQYLIHKIGISVGLGGILWLYWIIKGAIVLRDHTGSAHYDIQAGPILLNQLGKHHLIDGGYVIDFSFEFGMFWYLALFAAIGAAWGSLAYIRGWKRQSKE